MNFFPASLGKLIKCMKYKDKKFRKHKSISLAGGDAVGVSVGSSFLGKDKNNGFFFFFIFFSPISLKCVLNFNTIRYKANLAQKRIG